MTKLLPVALLAVSACTIFDDITYRPNVGPLQPDAAPLNACGQPIANDGCADSNPGMKVSFQKDVLAGIFNFKCMSHTEMQDTVRFDLTTYQTLLRGGLLSGPDIIVPCNPCKSILVQKLGPTPPFGAQMPIEGSLSDGEIALIRDWIAEGAENN